MIRPMPIAAALTLIAAGAFAQPAAKPQAPAADGQALFMEKGCYECHGTVGQGSIMSGPALAPNTIPEVAFRTEVRTPRLQMPPYSPVILSDDELGDIYVYVRSIPAGPGADRIPLLAKSKP